MNVWTLYGNLARDAEQRFTASNDSIVSFSIPAKSGYGKNESIAWVKCSMFGKRGESILPYLKKGTSVVVSGEFFVNEWKTKEGEDRKDIGMRVNELTLAGGRKKDDEAEVPAPKSKPKKEQGSFDDMADDVPFFTNNVGVI